MKLKVRHIAGGACVLGGAGAYLWLMTAELVPSGCGIGRGIRYVGARACRLDWSDGGGPRGRLRCG